MEKVIYLLIGAEQAPKDLATRTTAAAFHQAGAKRVQINVVDRSFGDPFGVKPDASVPKLAAAVSLWVDAVDSVRMDRHLPQAPNGATWYGYLVTESERLRNTSVSKAADGRLPGLAQVVPLSVPEGMTWAEWRRRWQVDHTSVAIATQSTFRYVQNVVVRPLTTGSPRFAAVVEECFPAEAARDLHVFFDSVGDDAKLARHMAAMSESCDRFMDGSAPVAWTGQYDFDPA